MANESPLLKISSNLEIPQNNKKNCPTEDESNTMTDCPDEKPSEFEFPKDTVADATKGQSNFFSISFYSLLFVFSVQVKIREYFNWLTVVAIEVLIKYCINSFLQVDQFI